MLKPIAWPIVQLLIYIAFKLHFGRYTKLSVPTVTLGSVLDSHGVARVDLLNLDAERGEVDVLVGLSLAHWSRVWQVSVEVHDVELSSAQVSKLS